MNAIFSYFDGAPNEFPFADCDHRCCMVHADACCSCSDSRPERELYDIFIKDEGYCITPYRWLFYCPVCKRYCFFLLLTFSFFCLLCFTDRYFGCPSPLWKCSPHVVLSFNLSRQDQWPTFNIVHSPFFIGHRWLCAKMRNAAAHFCT